MQSEPFRSLSVYAINVAEKESKNELIAAMRSRTLDTVNDLIYARIGRIRPLGHHGPPTLTIIWVKVITVNFIL